MANAALGIPVRYSIGGWWPASLPRPVANVANDEPGLVGWGITMNTGDFADLVITMARGLSQLSFMCCLGLAKNVQSRLLAYNSLSDRDNNVNPIVLFDWTNHLSVNSSNSQRKHLRVFNGNNYTFLRVQFRVTQNGTPLDPWRILIGDWIEPPDNIEIGAESLIDDRQRRQYAITGRRNFVNAGVYPGFTGQWPWLSRDYYRSIIRPLSLRVGASFPVVFCLDREETAWGEDELYYGDLEKDQPLTHEDGGLYSFGFTIVDIAPVAPGDDFLYYAP